MNLSDEERALLEKLRVERGLRTYADVVRLALKELGEGPSVVLFKPTSPGRTDAPSETVTFGPVRSRPGVRLKKR